MKTNTNFTWVALVATIGIVALALINCGGDDKPTAKTFTVTFNSNGGTAVDTQTVAENGTATEPATPAKANDTAGLYVGTPDNYTFNGWYNNGTKWNFNTSVTESITLTAQWTAPTAVPLTLAGTDDIITKTVTYVNQNAKPEGYTLLLDTDVETGEQLFTVKNTTTITNLTLIGIGEERVIECIEESFFDIRQYSSLTIGENITLTSSNTLDIVSLRGGILRMKVGSKIINTMTNVGYGVFVERSSPEFFMEGGEISAIGDRHWDIGMTNGSTIISGGKLTGGNVVLSPDYGDVSLTLLGNVEIDDLELNLPKESYSRTFSIASSFTGTIGKLNLRVRETETITEWENEVIVSAVSGYTLTTADIAKFPLGDFTSSETTQPISDTHKLELDTTANVIKLVAK